MIKAVHLVKAVALITFFGKKNNGFTLIEILVVFSVIAILSGIGVSSLVSYGRSQQVNQNAQDTKLLVNQARFNALSVVKQNKNDSGANVSCGNSNLTGYSVVYENSRRISLYQVCSNSNSYRLRGIDLPTYLSFQGSSCTTVSFQALSAHPSANPQLPCTIRISGFNLTKTLTIDQIGNVSIN